MKKWKSLGLVTTYVLVETFVAGAVFNNLSAAAPSPPAVQWRGWDETVFKEAKKNHKLIILDLEAVWCHWCHVMEEETYKDPTIIQTLGEHFIAVRVDQDSRPDLSRRYEDYGWPATVIFDGSGRELAKRQGYIALAEMKELLSKLIKNPTPEDSTPTSVTAGSTFLLPDMVQKLVALHHEQYNTEYGGWGKVHKFLFGYSEEWALDRVRTQSVKAELDEKEARQTLDESLKLVDPAWGGVYQYSVKDWDHPHFEKIAEVQYTAIYLYTLAYSLWRDEKYLKAAQSVYSFLKTFLTSPEGAFYTSQDADLKPGQHSGEFFKLNDAERRLKGIPRIDQHVYARENGWFIIALCRLSAVEDGATSSLYRDQAIQVASWILKNRSTASGGFKHDQSSPQSQPFLGDSLEMARAFLSLYEVTADLKWLDHAKKAAQFMSKTFAYKVNGKQIGYQTSVAKLGPGLIPEPDRDENIELARFGNLLYHYTGDASFRTLAEEAMKYLTSTQIVNQKPTAGLLLANQELSEDPLHVTVLGSKSDETAKRLFATALRFPTVYKRVEWIDSNEKVTPKTDVKFPKMSKSAAFLCSKKRCSLPAFSPEDLEKRMKAAGK